MSDIGKQISLKAIIQYIFKIDWSASRKPNMVLLYFPKLCVRTNKWIIHYVTHIHVYIYTYINMLKEGGCMKIVYNCFGKNKIHKHEKTDWKFICVLRFLWPYSSIVWTYFQTQKLYQCYILAKFRSTLYTKNAGLCSPWFDSLMMQISFGLFLGNYMWWKK